MNITDDGLVLIGLYDKYTGENVNYQLVTLWYDGVTIMTDTQCDGVIYRKYNNQYWRRAYSGSTVFADWWGAKGDGTTDDTLSIQKAINFLAITGGGVLQFKSNVFIISHIDLKRNVSLKGSFTYGNLTSNNSTIFYCNTSGATMFSYLKDESFPTQTGEETLLYKSNPNISFEDITLDGQNKAKIGLDISECWGFRIYNCHFGNCFQYGLHLFDNNNFEVATCGIIKLMFISNADYNVVNNEISGTTSIGAYTSVISSFGMNTSNKIYYSPSQVNPYNFNITSIDNTGLFTTNSSFNLIANPSWLYSAGTGSFSYDATVGLTMHSPNNNYYVLVTSNLSPLIVGNSYTLTGSYTLDSSSANTTRSGTFTCGNVTQTYGSFNATSGVVTPFSITFTFGPTGPTSTAPLKIVVNSKSGGVTTGDDILIFNNLKIVDSSLGNTINKIPVVLSFDSSVDVTIRNNYLLAEAYYIKFFSATTFKLASSYYNYTNNIYVSPGVNLTSLTNVLVQTPQAVVSLIGKATACNTFAGNKIEDIETTGVLLRGAYGNTFSGNSIMKGNYSTTQINGISLEGGASYNVFSAGFLSNRYQITPFDKLNVAINVDKYSGHNVFSGLSSWGAKTIDIYDDYIGTSDNQNSYSGIVDNVYVWQQRALDYTLSNKTGYTFKAGISSITQGTPIITGKEFTLYFSDIVFADSSNDIILFEQTDAANTISGGLTIKRTTSKNIAVSIAGTIVYTGASNSLLNNVPYDVTIMRDLAYNWITYINGIKQIPVSSSNPNTDIASGGTIKTYLGGVETVTSVCTLKRFRFFNDLLSDTEIRSMFSSAFLDKNSFNVTNPLSSLTSGTAIFASSAGLTLSTSGSGYNGGSSVDVTLSSTNHSAVLAIGNLDNSLINKTIRLSFYAKSATVTVIAINRNSVVRYVTITTTYQKYSVTLKPDTNRALASTENIALSFGTELSGTFGSGFSALGTGLINLDNVNAFVGSTPIQVDLDLSNQISGQVFNNASTGNFTTWTIPDVTYSVNLSQVLLSRAGSVTNAAVEVRRDNTGISNILAVASGDLHSASLAQSVLSLFPTINQSSNGSWRGYFLSVKVNSTGTLPNYLANWGTNTLSDGLGSHAAKFSVLDSGQIFSASLTVSTVLLTDASKNIVSSGVTATQLGYLDATSSIQTQLNGKLATGSSILNQTTQQTGANGNISGTFTAGTLNSTGTASAGTRLAIGTNTIGSANLLISPTTFSTTVPFTNTGFGIRMDPTSYNSSAAGGTVSISAINNFGVATLTATNATVLTKHYANIFTSSIASTNVTIGSVYAAGFNGNVEIVGLLSLLGSVSGSILIQTQASAGTYNFNLPTTAGTAGQVLTSQGGGSSPMTWTTPAVDAVNTATDANYSVTSALQFVKLPAITANRTVTMPAAGSYTGQTIKIWNQNTAASGFNWTFGGATVKDATNTSITTLANTTVYILESDGANWIKMN